MDFKFSEILLPAILPGLWQAFKILLPFMILVIVFKILVNQIGKKK